MSSWRNPFKRIKAKASLAHLVQRLVTAQAEGTQMTYLAEFDVPVGATVPPVKKPARPAGLIAWHVVKARGDERIVVSYWASLETFERDHADWAKQLEVGRAIRSGWIGPVESYKPPLWKRLKLASVVITLAGVLAASQTIKNHGDFLIADPSILIRSDIERADVVEDEPIKLNARLVNQLQTMHRDVRIRAEIRKRLPPKPLAPVESLTGVAVSDAAFPELPEGKERMFTVSAPAARAGDYVVLLSARAKAGLFSPASEPTLEIPLKIWPKGPVARIRAERITPHRAKLVGDIDVGRDAENGLQCQLTVPGFKGLQHLTLNVLRLGSNVREWIPNGSSPDGVHVLYWTIPKTKGKQTVEVQAIFERTKEETDWDDLAKLARLACRNA